MEVQYVPGRGHRLIVFTAQSIVLYERLTKIIAKLADGVEAELQKRMESLDLHARQASEAMEQLRPQIEKLRNDLAGVHDYLSNNVQEALQKSSGSISKGLDTAANLQQSLLVLMKTVLDTTAHIASAHDRSLEQVTRRADSEIAALMSTMNSAIASSVSLQTEMVSRVGRGTSHRCI